MGVTIEGTDDGAIIQGMGANSQFGPAQIVTHHDHRIAMAFTIAGLRAGVDIKILDCAHVATSFPNFVELARTVGMTLDEEFQS
jgi:3-phosphoshikimate 1-carboxyvinyltransferase